MDSLDQEMHFYAVSSQGPPVQLQMQLVTSEMSLVTSRGPKTTVLVTGKLSQSVYVQTSRCATASLTALDYQDQSL